MVAPASAAGEMGAFPGQELLSPGRNFSTRRGVGSLVCGIGIPELQREGDLQEGAALSGGAWCSPLLGES